MLFLSEFTPVWSTLIKYQGDPQEFQSFMKMQLL